MVTTGTAATSSKLFTSARSKIKIAQQLWGQNNNGTCGIFEGTLNKLITAYPNHHDFDEVLVKCMCINTAYSTMLNKNDLVEIADGIAKSIAFSTYISTHPVNAVNFIASIGTHRHYSFATKYCALHFPNLYPIFDKFAFEALRYYNDPKNGYKPFRNKNITKTACQNYQNYIDIYNEFINAYGLHTFSYREIDKYLWHFAKNNFPVALKF